MRYKFIIGFLILTISIIATNVLIHFFVQDFKTSTYFSICAGLGVGLILAAFISKAMVKDIKKLVFISKEISMGDLTKEVIIKSKDEIGELAGSVKDMVISLQSLVSSGQNIAKNISTSAQDLSATAQEMNASTEEIASTVQSIAEGAEKQAVLSGDAVILIKKTSDLTINVSNTAQAASESASKAKEAAQVGGKASHLVVVKMKEVFDQIENSSKLVKGFGERTKEINKIVKVITGIAQQTNLLALNATIEAARAGDYGQGFAVVADEIKKLAENTSRFTEQIAQIAEKIEGESSNVLSSMEVGIKQVEEGRKVINIVNRALSDIISVVLDVVDKVDQITSLTKEQTTSTTNMVRSIDEIAKVALDNASSTEEASAATQQQTSVMEGLATSAQKLAEMSEELQRSLIKFKVNIDEEESSEKEVKEDNSLLTLMKKKTNNYGLKEVRPHSTT
ncbi:MAG: methyl-accepting chemotaxis protein [bacterium]